MVAMKFLILGDTHIPQRASKIPEEFEKLFKSLDYDAVICTGDLTSESVLKYLKNLSGDVYVVKGNMDTLPLPESEIIEVGRVGIGVIHGYQVYPRGDREQLQDIGLDMGVDILVSGHTHTPDVYRGRIVLLNPGSATGVWGGGAVGEILPAFMHVEVEDSVKGILYRLFKGEVLEEQFDLTQSK